VTPRPPVLLVGFDAAEISVVERLLAEGAMPHMAGLRERGCFGTLAGCATVFSGGAWPTMYTGKAVPWHGIYQHRMWRHPHQRHELIAPDWLPEPPFWRALADQGCRLVLLDVPMVAGAPVPVPGMHVGGWGTHDLVHRGSWPVGEWRRLEREFGRPRIRPAGRYGPPTVKSLLRIRDDLLRGTEQLGRIAKALLDRHPWDLAFVVFGGSHRGGHHFWDLSQIDTEGVPQAALETLRGALREIYVACDEALGRLLDAVAGDARVAVFAVHGMGPNSGWSERCADMLSRVVQGGPGAPARHGLLHAARSALSLRTRRRLRRLLPRDVRDVLFAWSQPRFDWARTRAFPLDMDLAGYVRLNLAGREPHGVVAPGEEYAALCRELAEGLQSFRDVASGRPVVEKVLFRDDLAPAGAPYRDGLPDLVVQWGDVSAITSPGLTSTRFGELRWRDGNRLPSGRSGNHRDTGWFVAAGPGIPAGVTARGSRIEDLAPTVFAWFDAMPPGDFQGAPIPEVSRAVAPAPGQP
jgi:predicted AlkP superfamily phosphohydrolase/phosphomutase